MGKYIGNGFVKMVLAFVALVLGVTMFGTLMEWLDDLLLEPAIADFIGFEIAVDIAPAVLMLALVGGSALLYYKGYKAIGASGQDTNGIIRMVFGFLLLILFVALFTDPLAPAFGDLYTLYVGSDYIAFDIVLQVVPTILFLAGVFATIGTGVSGYRARRRRRALA